MSTSTSTNSAVVRALGSDIDTYADAVTLTSVPRDQWAARLDALTAEATEATTDHDSALAVIGRIGQHGSTSHVEDWKTVAETVAEAHERAEAAILGAVRSVWWSMHDHKRAGGTDKATGKPIALPRITQAEVAHALGVTEATLSRRIKSVRRDMLAAMWRKHGVHIDDDDKALAEAVATLGSFREAHDKALAGDPEAAPVTRTEAEAVEAPDPVTTRQAEAERVAERVARVVAQAETVAEAEALAALVRQAVTGALAERRKQATA